MTLRSVWVENLAIHFSSDSFRLGDLIISMYGQGDKSAILNREAKGYVCKNGQEEHCMIKELPESEGHVLGIRITGKISLEMERKWISRCDKIVKEHGRIDILVFFDEHARWGIKAGIEDLKWALSHVKDIKKVAIVSDSTFWKWYVALDRPFGKMVGIDEKYFGPAEIANAWKWIKEELNDN